MNWADKVSFNTQYGQGSYPLQSSVGVQAPLAFNPDYMNTGGFNNGIKDLSAPTDMSLADLQKLGFDPKTGGFKTPDVATPKWGMGDYANLGINGIATIGNLLLGAKALNFSKKAHEQGLAEGIRSFNANYNAQRDLANAAMYDRNVRRNVELGQSIPEAQKTAQEYVDVRGIKSLG